MDYWIGLYKEYGASDSPKSTFRRWYLGGSRHRGAVYSDMLGRRSGLRVLRQGLLYGITVHLQETTRLVLTVSLTVMAAESSDHNEVHKS